MLRAVLTGLAVAALGASAQAAPRAKKPKPPVAVEILNQRAAVLEEFTLAAADAQDKPVARLAKPLPAGGKARLPIRKAKGCDYIARWKFADAGDEAQVDLCNDPKVVLTD